MEKSIELILDKITELCQTLGIKITEFYPYVVRQQFIKAYIYLGIFIISLISFIWTYRKGNRKDWFIDYLEAPTLFYTMIIICGLISSIFFILFISQGIGYILNPHYWAIRDILHMIK